MAGDWHQRETTALSLAKGASTFGGDDAPRTGHRRCFRRRRRARRRCRDDAPRIARGAGVSHAARPTCTEARCSGKPSQGTVPRCRSRRAQHEDRRRPPSSSQASHTLRTVPSHVGVRAESRRTRGEETPLSAANGLLIRDRVLDDKLSDHFARVGGVSCTTRSGCAGEEPPESVVEAT